MQISEIKLYKIALFTWLHNTFDTSHNTLGIDIVYNLIYECILCILKYIFLKLDNTMYKIQIKF